MLNANRDHCVLQHSRWPPTLALDRDKRGLAPDTSTLSQFNIASARADAPHQDHRLLEMMRSTVRAI